MTKPAGTAHISGMRNGRMIISFTFLFSLWFPGMCAVTSTHYLIFSFFLWSVQTASFFVLRIRDWFVLWFFSVLQIHPSSIHFKIHPATSVINSSHLDLLAVIHARMHHVWQVMLWIMNLSFSSPYASLPIILVQVILGFICQLNRLSKKTLWFLGVRSWFASWRKPSVYTVHLWRRHLMIDFGNDMPTSLRFPYFRNIPNW